MREALDWNRSALNKHKRTKRHIHTVNALGNEELSNDLLRFAFLTMVKTSQAEHPVPAHTRVVTEQGLSVVLLRYEDCNKELVF